MYLWAGFWDSLVFWLFILDSSQDYGYGFKCIDDEIGNFNNNVNTYYDSEKLVTVKVILRTQIIWGGEQNDVFENNKAKADNFENY